MNYDHLLKHKHIYVYVYVYVCILLCLFLIIFNTRFTRVLDRFFIQSLSFSYDPMFTTLWFLHNQGSIYGLFFNQGSIYGCDSNQGSKYGFFSNVESNRYFSIYCSSIPLRPYLVITHNGLKVRSLFYSSLINS
jgi:hypothetical protein